ncbi:MAG: hypothetical protein ACOCUU_02835 [Nanoarchaeota archaeon]
MSKCLGCNKELGSERVIDLCDRCGISMYGKKTFNTIVDNLKDAQIKGDLLEQGEISENLQEKPTNDEFGMYS